MASSIERQFVKLTPIEHALLRPDTLVGSMENAKQTMWVHTGAALERREVTITTGLFKIADEIYVNAADNFVRNPGMMKKLAITVEKRADGRWFITVLNDGPSIPVVMHEKVCQLTNLSSPFSWGLRHGGCAPIPQLVLCKDLLEPELGYWVLSLNNQNSLCTWFCGIPKYL